MALFITTMNFVCRREVTRLSSPVKASAAICCFHNFTENFPGTNRSISPKPTATAVSALARSGSLPLIRSLSAAASSSKSMARERSVATTSFAALVKCPNFLNTCQFSVLNESSDLSSVFLPNGQSRELQSQCKL